MNEFFKYNFKYIIQIIVITLLVILLVRSCTTVPDKNNLLEYKIDQLNKNIDSLTKLNSNIDKKIVQYENDIKKIDSTIAEIKVKRTTINNYYEEKKKKVIGMDKKQIDSTLRDRVQILNMKKIIFLFTIILSLNISAQKGKCEDDSTIICIPTEVGQKILTDLIDLDRLRQDSSLCEQEITQLELKIEKKEEIIKGHEDKEKKLNDIIILKEEKYKLVDDENNKLRDDIGKLKTKNTIIEIVAGSIIGGLVYIFVFK